MPNFWTRTVQKIKESLSGPRTNDIDLVLKLNQMKDYEKALKKLKNIIMNFSQYFETIFSYNKDINECLLLFYNTEDFKEFADSLISVHAENNHQLKLLTDNVIQLNQNILNWDNFFDEIKDNVKITEESRKIYDHYEKKLEKLENKKSEMIKEVRNEEKFMKSKEDYINKAIKSYDIMERLNTEKYYVINPILLKLFSTELKIFETFKRNYSYYQNLEEQLNLMYKKYIEQNKHKKSYNPLVFMKNSNIDESFVKSNEKSLQKFKINSEECKVNLENRMSENQESNKNKIMLINFDDIVKNEVSNNVNELANDIFSCFTLNYGEDKKKEINNINNQIENKFIIPENRDSEASYQSRLSQFPTYKSVIGDNAEVIDYNYSLDLRNSVNNNSSVIANKVINPSQVSNQSKTEKDIDLLDALEKSNFNTLKRKGSNIKRELVDPFEGFY